MTEEKKTARERFESLIEEVRVFISEGGDPGDIYRPNELFLVELVKLLEDMAIRNMIVLFALQTNNPLSNESKETKEAIVEEARKKIWELLEMLLERKEKSH